MKKIFSVKPIRNKSNGQLNCSFKKADLPKMNGRTPKKITFELKDIEWE